MPALIYHGRSIWNFSQVSTDLLNTFIFWYCPPFLWGGICKYRIQILEVCAATLRGLIVQHRALKGTNFKFQKLYAEIMRTTSIELSSVVFFTRLPSLRITKQSNRINEDLYSTGGFISPPPLARNHLKVPSPYRLASIIHSLTRSYGFRDLSSNFPLQETVWIKS